MNQDDVIRMAREAGATPSRNPELWDIWNIRDTDLERFAALIAAKEREECANMTDHELRDCPRCGHCCPQRPWVGLTEIEIVDIEAEELTSASSETFSFARAIENKLREKNGGEG
jgi:hypothetical protein